MSAVASILAALSLAGGLQGVVTRAPTQPVCRVGEPCSAPAAGLKLLFVRGAHRYRIALPPGTYAARLARTAPIGRGLEPATVVAPRGRFATRNFSYDTGIR